jgi:hypothetical protein
VTLTATAEEALRVLLAVDPDEPEDDSEDDGPQPTDGGLPHRGIGER